MIRVLHYRQIHKQKEAGFSTASKISCSSLDLNPGTTAFIFEIQGWYFIGCVSDVLISRMKIITVLISQS